MIILQDSREQAPLKFDHDFITEVEIGKLDVGDYGCRFKNGFIPPVFFERKGLGDLFSTLGGGYARFKREIALGASQGVKLVIIIEGTVTDILLGYEHSKIKGITILRKLFTLWIRYGVPFVTCESRYAMSTYIAEYYCSIGRQALHDMKTKKSQGSGSPT